MNNKYISYNREQAYLLPPSIDDWLPQDHLARFIKVILQLESIAQHQENISQLMKIFRDIKTIWR